MRHADGTPDEVTLYGGVAVDAGSALSQSFPADRYTANLIPEAATNEWFLSFSADGQELTYYLERHGKARFKAVLNKCSGAAMGQANAGSNLKPRLCSNPRRIIQPQPRPDAISN